MATLRITALQLNGNRRISNRGICHLVHHHCHSGWKVRLTDILEYHVFPTGRFSALTTFVVERPASLLCHVLCQDWQARPDTAGGRALDCSRCNEPGLVHHVGFGLSARFWDVGCRGMQSPCGDSDLPLAGCWLLLKSNHTEPPPS